MPDSGPMTLKITQLLAVFCFASQLKAEVLHWPQLCLNGKLKITNNSNENVRTWLQRFSEDGHSETEMNVGPHRKSTFVVTANSFRERFSLLHFSQSGLIQTEFICDNGLSSVAHSLEGGVLTFKKSDLDENKIWLQNLFSDTNHVRLQYLDSSQNIVDDRHLILSSRQQLNQKNLQENQNFTTVRVTASQRFTAFNLSREGSDSPFQFKAQKSNLDLNASYFLVGPRSGFGDTFVVQITSAEMIARARELVAHPETEKILFAKIVKGHQGFNRNWSKPEKSFWSWSVSEVTNFADIGSTACNGFPQVVEDNVDAWLKNPGRICFWNYRIKKELTAAQVASPE